MIFPFRYPVGITRNRNPTTTIHTETTEEVSEWEIVQRGRHSHHQHITSSWCYIPKRRLVGFNRYIFPGLAGKCVTEAKYPTVPPWMPAFPWWHLWCLSHLSWWWMWDPTAHATIILSTAAWCIMYDLALPYRSKQTTNAPNSNVLCHQLFFICKEGRGALWSLRSRWLPELFVSGETPCFKERGPSINVHEHWVLLWSTSAELSHHPKIRRSPHHSVFNLSLQVYPPLCTHYPL